MFKSDEDSQTDLELEKFKEFGESYDSSLLSKFSTLDLGDL